MKTSINGVTYHYLDTQTRDATKTLILLHGFTGSSANWEPLIPAWTRYARIIAVDLLGHGKTDAPDDPDRYAMAHAADDLMALMKHVDVGDDVYLMGYSMGGRLALYTALAHPSRLAGLILESASPGLKTDSERRQRAANDDALADRIEAEGITAFVDYWQQIPLFASQAGLPDDIRKRLRAQRLTNRPAGLANSLRGMGTGRQASLWPRLPDLRMPVHLITGALDAKFMAIARDMATILPQANHISVADVGHTVHLEAHATVAHFVSQILTEQHHG